MAYNNQGDQKIGWKWSTPLDSGYLRTFLAGMSSPGLLSRPRFDITITGTGANVIINSFSALIIPPDQFYVGNAQATPPEYNRDENGNIFYPQLVKFTLGTSKEIAVTEADVAIALHYTIAEPGKIASPSWYADINVLDSEDLRTTEKYNPDCDIIIGTIQFYKTDIVGGSTYCSITTAGADISDALLIEEGWDPNCWLSVTHPTRAWGLGQPRVYYNSLEVRKHNKLYSSIISGTEGVVSINTDSVTYNIPHTGTRNPNGERGQMPDNYNCFALQSNGFSLSDGGVRLPITKQSGGIFALVDATGQLFNPDDPTNPAHATDETAFTNKLKISPVRPEDINVYYNSDNETLFIK